MGNWIGDESDWWNRGAGGDPGTSDKYDARFVPRNGFVRDAYDTVIEYDGSIKGRKDKFDLLGPSAGETHDAATVGPGESKPWFFKLMDNPSIFFGVLLIPVALYLLGPVFELLASAMEG